MSYVCLRRGKFVKLLSQPDLLWKREMVKHGYVSYNTLCNETSQGQKTVDSMIESNIIHLRPCAVFPFDIEGMYSEYPIITPHVLCDVLIMKELLHQHNG